MANQTTIHPDNICPSWCKNYQQFAANGKYTEESKKACMECCSLDIEKHGQSG